MDGEYDRRDYERAWAGAVVVLAAVLAVGAALFPRRVYDEFLWQYLWGPVVADAYGAQCAQRLDGQTILLDTAVDCGQAAGIIARPGYTTLSTISYAAVLLLMLVGVVFLLDRLNVGNSRSFFFALIPFALFGGVLRTVEDANVALFHATGDFAILFPWSGLIISPFIYFTVFAIALVALVGSVGAAHRNLVEGYEYALAGVGTVILFVTTGSLLWLSATTTVLGFHPIVPAVTLGGATVIGVLFWIGTERYTPFVNAGTGLVGSVIVWGHTVDGIANVLILDWWREIGLPGGYTPKHVVNRGIISITETLQPAWLSDAIGTAWPFLFVKIAAAAFIVWLFNDEAMEESPRLSMLLLVAVLAVGLGPGTRDFLRATFGI
jgi:uncharacterized membrane protein